MALPSIMRKLFQNDGYGPLLKDEIVSRHISVQDWSNAYDYPVATVARGSDGALYYSKLQSGPGTAAGAKDPALDDGTYWSAPPVKTVDVLDSSSAAASTAWVNAWLASVVALPSDLYVDPVNGDDANDGYSAATAKATVSGATDLIVSSDHISPAVVRVHLAPGDYSGQSMGSATGVLIVYDATAGAVSFSSQLYVADNRRVALEGEFVFVNNRIQCGYGGALEFRNGTKITFRNASQPYVLYAYTNGVIYVKNGWAVSIGFSGTCSCSTAILNVQYGALFSNYGTLSWFGSATGKRYQVTGNATIRGVGTNSIPGSAAGTTDSSSYFS